MDCLVRPRCFRRIQNFAGKPHSENTNSRNGFRVRGAISRSISFHLAFGK